MNDKELIQKLTDIQTEEQSKKANGDEIQDEIADIFIYLLRLSDKLSINIEQAIRSKMEQNAKKYPVELSKGNAIKYNKRNDSK